MEYSSFHQYTTHYKYNRCVFRGFQIGNEIEKNCVKGKPGIYMEDHFQHDIGHKQYLIHTLFPNTGYYFRNYFNSRCLAGCCLKPLALYASCRERSPSILFQHSSLDLKHTSSFSFSHARIEKRFLVSLAFLYCLLAQQSRVFPKTYIHDYPAHSVTLS